MANIAIITAKKLINGNIEDCVFIATQQGDGYLYFNDDMFYRCTPDKDNLAVNIPTKNYWIRTDMLEITNIISFNASKAQNLIYGAGSVSEDADVEKAVQWAIDKATNEYITYDYTTNSVRDVNSDQYNCSTFVITAFWQAGFPVNSCVNTMTMVSDFTNCGFTFIPGTFWEAEYLKRGDIQIKEFDPGGHTNIYIGNNQDVDCGATPLRILTHTVNNWGSGWDGILRYTG